jgi:flagellar hook protein FlgE
MSLFGAMNTAISGLSAQSNAFGNISDNVANSQTVGYKRVDTSFIDYLTSSTAANNVPGSVVTRPDYVNNVEGTITQTDNPLGLAITGQGFFAVSKQAGTANNLPTFDAQQEYTRAGDFQMDKSGYLKNSAGMFLNGWPVDQTTGVVNQNTLKPIQVSQSVFNPIATKNVTLSANLPATPTAGTLPITSNINVYDKTGTLHVMTLSWAETAANTPNDWTVTLTSPDDTAITPDPITGEKIIGTADVKFGQASTNSVPEGTIGSMLGGIGGTGSSGILASAYALNGPPATLSFNSTFNQVSQPITINLGTYAGTSGVTQYAGTDYNLRGLTQDGVPPGAFSSVSTASNGDIAVNYDNGQSNVIYRVPIITFNDPNGLQRQDGQSFTVSQDSGGPLAETANTNGAGGLITQSTESSNVDIASEFTKLIVAQRAYSANTKIVTTSDDMLQQTIDMKR